MVKEALIEANRRDLIGFGPACLIPPRPIGQGKVQNQGRNKTGQSRGGQSRYARSGSPSQVNKTKGERKKEIYAMKRWMAFIVLMLFVLGMMGYGIYFYREEQIEKSKAPVRGEITVYTDLPNNFNNTIS